MDIEQWINQVSEAYESAGVPFSLGNKEFLLAESSTSTTQDCDEIISEVTEVMLCFFFKKASIGETFGSLTRIKERFGKSLEENYGLSSGPFIDMAKAYWTYRLEVDDLFRSEHYDLVLSQILKDLEIDIASVFFPFPGHNIPVSQRRETQRQLLQEYAPEIDIERFLSENPILEADSIRELCSDSGQAISRKQVLELEDSQSFMRAYKNRPELMGIVGVLWLSVIINSLRAVYYLISGQFGNAGSSLLWGIGSFAFWYAIDNWALRHPKE